MNANILKPRSHDDACLSSRIRAGTHRKSRALRPSTEGMEQRLQLSAVAVGSVAVASVVKQNPPGNPPLTIAIADLAVESVKVQSLGNNQFKVTATLENLPPHVGNVPNIVTGGGVGTGLPTPGVTYPGGGVFKITRTDGGTTLSLSSNNTLQASPDPVNTIASMPIPSLAPGKSIQLSTITTGPALFTAAAGPTVLESNPANDRMTVDNLVSRTLPINTATLGALSSLTNAIHNTQFRLDASNSSIVVPGIFTDRFKIPGKSVSIGVGPFSDTVTYTVNNLVSSSVALSYEQGGLAITVKFADNANALVSDSLIAPNISVAKLQVKILFPLSYNESGQYLNLNSPHVTVTGNWNANGLLGPVFDLLLPDINANLASGVTSAIQPNLGLLSYQLNKPLHDLTAGGRLVSANIQQDQLNLTVETPS